MWKSGEVRGREVAMLLQCGGGAVIFLPLPYARLIADVGDAQRYYRPNDLERMINNNRSACSSRSSYRYRGMAKALPKPLAALAGSSISTVVSYTLPKAKTTHRPTQIYTHPPNRLHRISLRLAIHPILPIEWSVKLPMCGERKRGGKNG
jgi:hypothetical protein